MKKSTGKNFTEPKHANALMTPWTWIMVVLCFVFTAAGCATRETKEEVTIPVTDQAVLLSTGDKWHDLHPMVAHALGTVDGRTETNSKEAFIHSYGAGQRVFEADFSMTSDGHLVVRHDFEQISYYNLEQVPGDELVMDYETFMNTKIKYLYTHLDADALCGLLAIYPDAYLITDTKNSDEKTVRLQFTLFSEAVLKHDGLDKRVIVQIYNKDMYETVKNVYPFENFIFTLYQTADPDYEDIAAFCAENGIGVLTIASERFSPTVAQIFHKRGVKVYVHTINRADTMAIMTGYGADGFYSDYITPGDYEEITG